MPDALRRAIFKYVSNSSECGNELLQESVSLFRNWHSDRRSWRTKRKKNNQTKIKKTVSFL